MIALINHLLAYLLTYFTYLCLVFSDVCCMVSICSTYYFLYLISIWQEINDISHKGQWGWTKVQA